MGGEMMRQEDGPVLVIGSGLIGTSVALALRRRGVDVWLEDRSAECVAEAVAKGAGRAFQQATSSVSDTDTGERSEPSIVVVAVPPLVKYETHSFPNSVREGRSCFLNTLKD